MRLTRRRTRLARAVGIAARSGFIVLRLFAISETLVFKVFGSASMEETGIRIIIRIMGLLLTVIAMQFVISGALGLNIINVPLQ
jgi:small neutral amino acid transporter SnatA (MarC family)